MIHLIAYDLHNPGRDYGAVSKLIMSADSWAHPQGSVWLVDTLLETAVWRDKLHEAGDDNDEYFVARLHDNTWASWRMDATVGEWLNSPQRRW